MPELPEVEIAARNLRRWTAGRAVLEAEIDAKARRIVRPSTPRTVAGHLAGARFGAIGRKGKHLLIALEQDGGALGLLAHLGMTGKWLRRAPGEATPRFSRARFRLDDGGILHFEDLRLFGRLRLVPGAHFDEVPEVAALGPDPLVDGIDPARLAAGLGRTRLPVKTKLLDQALLAGVGNIYASESLFRARIDPRRPSRDLGAAEVRRLAGAIIEAMQDGIARQESPEITYVEEGGENPFLVYAREGERCPRCGRADLQRIVQAQRSTFFCPRCQR
jgi:formamidopyrimidine-DNA glycosylase